MLCKQMWGMGISMFLVAPSIVSSFVFSFLMIMVCALTFCIVFFAWFNNSVIFGGYK